VEKIQSFYLIGIAVRTSNENGQAAQDIPALWNRFMSDNLMAQIPNKIGGTVYCIYTDYEKDHTKPYTTIIGCKVSTLDEVPKGMIGKTIEGGSFHRRTAKGNISEGLVYNEWVSIWNADLNRAYNADFEVYDERAANPGIAEVDIFLSMNEG